MTDVTAKIELYHRLFLVCLGLAIFCLVLVVILFFVLDIRTVLGFLTGRHAKKKIRELEADNAKSGRLSARERSSMQYVAQDMKADMGVRQPASPGARRVENAVEQEQETSLLQKETDPDAATEVLQNSAAVSGKFILERELILIHTEEVI